MKKLIVLFLTISTYTAAAQLHINDTTNYSANLDNTAIMSITPKYTYTNSQGQYEEEFVAELHVHNTGNDTIELKVRTTELDICPESKNATCWFICPGASPSGTVPMQISVFSEIIAPGDSVNTFAGHYYTTDTTCCARYLYEWLDVNNGNAVVASLQIRYDATHTGTCTVGVEEQNKMEVELMPNPAKETLTIGNLNAIQSSYKNVQIHNSMGKLVRNITIETYQNEWNINVKDIPNGLYFVSIVAEGNVVGSEKLLIQH